MLAGKSSQGAVAPGSDMDSDGSLRGASASAGGTTGGGSRIKGMWRKAFKSTKKGERSRATPTESDSASSISAVSSVAPEKPEATNGDRSPSYKRLVSDRV